MKKETKILIKELTYYSSLGLQIVLSIFIGLGIGLFLDKIFKTTPVLTLIFILLGIAAGFRNVLLAIKKMKND